MCLMRNTCTVQEIGEEFVEFLEKELNITEAEVVENNDKRSSKGYESYGSKGTANGEADKGDNSINDNIDEIEAALAQLKKELGL